MNNIELAISASAAEAKKTVIELSKSLKDMAEIAVSAGKAVLSFAKNLALTSLGVGKFQSGLGKLLDSMKRIVFYRAIRTAIREITQGFKEGTNNLYQYSIALGGVDAAHAVATMNELATASLYVKNSLGAAAMPVLEALIPVANAIADAFVAAANAVNMFIQALRGNTQFTKAKRYATEYADALDHASGSAKEFKKQVFGFDELNIFNSPSGGGGGGAEGLDYSQMFEEADISDFMANLKKMMDEGEWVQVGSLVAERLNELVANFDAAKFGEKLGTKLRGGIGAAIGFMATFNFKESGTKLATWLNNVLYSMVDPENGISYEAIGETLARKITGIIDFGIGFLEEFDFGYAGAAIGDIIKGWFNGLSKWVDEVDWEGFGGTLYQKVYDFVTGLDFPTIAIDFFKLFGESLRAAWDLTNGFTTELVEDISNYFNEKSEECGGNAIAGFFKGIWDAMKDIAKWIYENVVFPFVDALLEGFGIPGFGEDSVVLEEVGEGAIGGLIRGADAKLAELFETVKKWVKPIMDLLSSLHDAIWHAEADVPRLSDWGKVPGYAEGGTPQTGSLFWAGESGAELVGSVGGRTTVTNQEQFTAGMEEIMDNTNTVILQAAQALIQAIQSKDMTAVVSIGDRQIVSAYDRGKKLAGASLVE